MAAAASQGPVLDHVTSGSSGTGNGSVGYSVAVSLGLAVPTGTTVIAGQLFTVIQSNVILKDGFDSGP